MAKRTKRSAMSRRLILAGVVLVLLVSMGLGTKIVGKGEAKSAESGGLDPAKFASDKFSSVIAPQITKQAKDVVVVADAIKADPVAAAKKYAKSEGSSAPVFSVVAKGTAGEVNSDGLMLVAVKGMPAGVKVYVQMGPAINGSAVRDATGTVHFQQFVNQLDYQTAAGELNNQVKAKVLKGLDAKALDGKPVTVTGVFQLGNPEAYILAPVKIEAPK
jgi:predicted lipoprotein